MSDVTKRVSIRTAPVAGDLDASAGWVGMSVQFLVDESTGADSFVFGRTIFEPSAGSHAVHRHPHAEEAVMIVRGRGVAINGADEVAVGPGDVVFHPRGEWHGFRNTSPDEEVEMIWVWGGAASRRAAGYEVSGADDS